MLIRCIFAVRCNDFARPLDGLYLSTKWLTSAHVLFDSLNKLLDIIFSSRPNFDEVSHCTFLKKGFYALNQQPDSIPWRFSFKF